MEYRMKDIMEPPKTLEEQKKEAREAAMAAAFTEFKQGFSEEEFRNLFAGGKNVVTAWRITEGTKSKIVITQYDTQINTNTLQQDGFTEAAIAEKLFYADRQTKTLEFVGRM